MTDPADPPARERLMEALREFAHKVEAACAKADGYESVRDTWWEWEMPDMSSVLAAVEEVVAETITAHEEARERDAY